MSEHQATARFVKTRGRWEATCSCGQWECWATERGGGRRAVESQAALHLARNMADIRQ